MLEGLALTADKSYKLLAKAYPYMAKRLLTDSSPELRSASFSSCSQHVVLLSTIVADSLHTCLQSNNAGS